MPTNEIMIVNPTFRSSKAVGQDTKMPDAIRIGSTGRHGRFQREPAHLVERGDIDKATALEFSPNPEQKPDGLKGIKVAASGLVS